MEKKGYAKVVAREKKKWKKGEGVGEKETLPLFLYSSYHADYPHKATFFTWAWVAPPCSSKRSFKSSNSLSSSIRARSACFRTDWKLSKLNWAPDSLGILGSEYENLSIFVYYEKFQLFHKRFVQWLTWIILWLALASQLIHWTKIRKELYHLKIVFHEIICTWQGCYKHSGFGSRGPNHTNFKPFLAEGKFGQNCQISLCKMLKHKKHHVTEMPLRFHLNGHIVEFRPQTQKLGSLYKTSSFILTVKRI